MKFKPCFSRETAFGWFAVIVIGLMIRSDHLGVTSIVRELSLKTAAYTAMLHFFRADSWYILNIKNTWLGIIKHLPCLITESGRYILIADGVKQSKEGRKIPGVKKLHQESENSAKGEYIFGHFFGGLGILAGNTVKQYSLLISVRLHEGIEAIGKWYTGNASDEESHVVKMTREALDTAGRLGSSILLLDRLYLTRPMLKTIQGQTKLHAVTKAKLNAKAFFEPEPKTGRGAKRKKGDTVKVADFFVTRASEFAAVTMSMYQKDKEIKYFHIDLLWGQQLYQKLRFVLTETDGTRSILVSTDLTLDPLKIVKLYCHRFKIECSFRELKQVVSGFSYHFWSKVMPKLNKYKSNKDNQAVLENISDTEHRRLIKSTVSAVEGYVQLSVIALGLLQITSLMFSSEINRSRFRFMRTISNVMPSEATVADYLRKNIYMLFQFFPDLPLTAIIKKHQMPPPEDSERISV